MKKILLFTIFGLISSAETPDKEHEGAKKKIEDILQRSPFKATSQRSFSSPKTSRTISRFSELGKKLKNTPSKTKERILAISLAADILPADEVRSLVSELSPSSTTALTSSPGVLLSLSDKFLQNANSPTFSASIQKRLKADTNLTPRLKGNFKDLERLSPGSAPRLVNTHHLIGEGRSGGHLFETAEEYTNNFINPTIDKVGREPIINPEKGVSVGFYKNPAGSKTKFSTVFPRGLTSADIYKIMQNTKTIIHDEQDNRSLEIATLDDGTKIPIVVHHNKSGMLDQPFPVWTYKELGEQIPSFDITRDEILNYARADFDNPIISINSPIAYENQDFIVYDLAKKLYNSDDLYPKSLIQKGALVKIYKSELR